MYSTSPPLANSTVRDRRFGSFTTPEIVNTRSVDGADGAVFPYMPPSERPAVCSGAVLSSRKAYRLS